MPFSTRFFLELPFNFSLKTRLEPPTKSNAIVSRRLSLSHVHVLSIFNRIEIVDYVYTFIFTSVNPDFRFELNCNLQPKVLPKIATDRYSIN